MLTEIVAASDSMWKQSVWPSVITASLASQYLKDGGLVTLPGAQAALQGTPGEYILPGWSLWLNFSDVEQVLLLETCCHVKNKYIVCLVINLFNQ